MATISKGMPGTLSASLVIAQIDNTNKLGMSLP